MTQPELVILITTTATSIVSVINSINNSIGRRKVDEKLTAIHEQTNGGWAEAHRQLSTALQEIINLKKIIAQDKRLKN